MGEYVLLTREGDGERWARQPGTVEASGAEAAVRATKWASGDVVAVPARSWTILRVSTERVERKRVAVVEEGEPRDES